LFGEIHDGFGATEDFTFTGNDAHLAQQLIGRQREKGCYTGVLQCREAKTALLECAAESPRQRSTNSAIAVEENPASRGAAAFRVSHF
jgi:hypothetical protein